MAQNSLIAPRGNQLFSVQQAADLLGLPRHFVASRVEAGEIPVLRQIGDEDQQQYLLTSSAVTAWNKLRRTHGRQALSALARSIENEHYSGELDEC